MQGGGEESDVLGEVNELIHKLNHKSFNVAKSILDVQIPSYKIEAEIIQFTGIPQLKDTSENIMKSKETFFGYFLDSVLCGLISYKKEKGILEIHRLVVHPDYFRRGIGRSLIQFVMDENLDVCKFIVHTGYCNTPAKSLYLSLGFREVEKNEVAPEVFLSLLEKRTN